MNTSRIKILVACVLVSFLFCYLEWGKGQGFGFIFQMEYTILFGSSGTRDTYTHPAVLIPFTGQVLLLICLFQKAPKKVLCRSGLALQSLLVLFILLAGSLALNIKIIGSTLPFLASAILLLRAFRRYKTV